VPRSRSTCSYITSWSNTINTSSVAHTSDSFGHLSISLGSLSW